MQYTINKDNYHDFKVFEVNKLPPRSYFIPYPTRGEADAAKGKEKRYRSSKVVCLNGEWDFKFYKKPEELPDLVDTGQVQFDKLDVPSCLQFRGYDRPFYVNMRYQFPYDPPKIPTTGKVGKTFCWIGTDQGIKPRWQEPGEEYNFAGLYRRYFTVKDADKIHELSFLGVASCIDVYVNGSFVGYSEGAHNTAEFDISPYVHEGENELVGVVRRWCNGSYLECQDMFRNNGIFRDVLLRISEKGDIRDIGFKTKKTEKGYKALAAVKLYGDGEVTFTLEGHGLKEIRTVISKDGKASVQFEDFEVEEWSAENPVLYDLYYEVAGCCVKERVGFKQVEIKDTVFFLNQKKVKLHGVNHHDTSPVNGYTLTPEEIERDMRLCKEYNIDTVRTSHYPPDPYLLEVCDELGLYVVDEADLETHGTMAHRFPPNYNLISDDPKWERHYMDRVRRLYQRDKVHACIIMWSLGNEAGGYHNTDKMYAYLKRHTTLPVHYESAIHTKRKAYDVASEMYPPVKRVHQVGEKTVKVKELRDRPYFMCEYAHAMGVGPGDVESYWKEIYSYDNLMGGCVWEMVDHAVFHGAEDGILADRKDPAYGKAPYRYTYGGDHGEWEHDGNFCVDGLFYPDRTPSTGAKIIKFIYRPLRVSYCGGNKFEVFNTRAFTEGSRYLLKFQWSDGTEVAVSPQVPPLGRVQIEMEVESRKKATEDAGERLLLTVATIDMASDRNASRDGFLCSAGNAGETGAVNCAQGREVAREQLVFSYPAARTPKDAGKVALPEGFQARHSTVRVPVGNGHLEASDPYTILFRAPTDNDCGFALKTAMDDFIVEKEEVLSVKTYPVDPSLAEGHPAGLSTGFPFGKTLSTKKGVGRVEVATRITCKKAVFTCTDCYEGSAEGIVVTSRLHCEKGKGDLPRFGKAYRLDKDFEDVIYLGRNGESYADMKEHAQISEVSCKVADMTEPNIRPQESGNRCDCLFASVGNAGHRVTFTAVDEPFELGIKPYSDRMLLKMKHQEDEVATGTYVTISAFQMGIGTGSCGPKTAAEYCYPMEQDYVLKFVIGIS